VVHRDVSPQNVFVGFDGAVKVVDFGIALARDRLQHTETGTLKGKLGYISPEQASGAVIDRRADVWALGVCLWEMLVGKRLFRRGSATETLRAALDSPIERPSSMRASIPAALDAIVMRALSRDPGERHPSARALARELEAFVRSTGEATGLSDLAEWIAPRFAEEREKKSEIVHTLMHEASTARREGGAGTRTIREGEREEAEGRVGPVTASVGDGVGRADARGAGPGSGPGPGRGRGPGRGPGSGSGSGSGSGPGSGSGSASAPGSRTVLGPPPSSVPRRSRIVVGVGLALAVSSIALAAVLGAAREAPEVRATPLAPAFTATTAAAADPPPAPSSDPAPRADVSPPDVAIAAARGRRPRTSATIATAGEGWLTIAATGGWAEIFDGDRNLGQTPTRVRLRAGRHALTVRPFGRAPERRIAAVVVAGETTSLVVPLR
jgi:hypothetical protein